MDRSTFRTSTPGGTLSTTGAKLRMLVIPAARSRFQQEVSGALEDAVRGQLERSHGHGQRDRADRPR
jgi:hypothetical protein